MTSTFKYLTSVFRALHVHHVPEQMFFCLFFLLADEDDEGERNNVPLTPLDSFFSDDDSLKQQKKKKPKKIKEGKIPKVIKRKKEVRCNSHSLTSISTLAHRFGRRLGSSRKPYSCLFSTHCFLMCLQLEHRFILAVGLLNERQWTVSGRGGGWQPCCHYCQCKQ